MFQKRPKRIAPGPGQESVWDYPRPPRLEAVRVPIRIEHNGERLVDAAGGFRVLETSHPPTYYIRAADVDESKVEVVAGGSVCEWKGPATYLDVVIGGERLEKVAFRYDDPTPSFRDIQGYYSFYAWPFDRVTVNDEVVTPQPGRFYSGWITANVVGPFKGEPGTWGW
mgnify:CR=1 FL=1